jgi:MFS family permease
MERFLQPDPGEERARSFWKNPTAWLRTQELSRDYWVFFAAAFFFDFGFAVYHFLFNLYLSDYHFNERSIGLITSASTLGSVAGTLPVGVLARKLGIRPLLLVCFVVAPVLGAVRTVLMAQRAQMVLAFLFGLTMCLWGVCFLPAIARVTTDANRQSAFSLIASAAIGTAMLGGIVCGYLPQWLHSSGFAMQPAEMKRLILLASCGIAALGLLPVLRMRRTHAHEEAGAKNAAQVRTLWQRWKPDPFLLRFIPAMALWTVLVTSFNPFANIYLSKVLHIPFARIGFIFSTAQVVQLITGLLTPLLFRVIGMINGITATQMAAAFSLACLAGTHHPELAVVMYLAFSAMQWMTAPGMYNLLMSRVQDSERATASSIMMFCNALTGAAATAATGILFSRFGYPPILAGIAVAAVVAAMALRSLIGRSCTTAATATGI